MQSIFLNWYIVEKPSFFKIDRSWDSKIKLKICYDNSTNFLNRERFPSIPYPPAVAVRAWVRVLSVSLPVGLATPRALTCPRKVNSIQHR